MKTFAAGEAKNFFGRMLDTVQREPVVIEKKGRAVAVVMSMEEYERFEELKNGFWASKAEEADKNGYLGEEETDKLLKRMLNAKD